MRTDSNADADVSFSLNLCRYLRTHKSKLLFLSFSLFLSLSLSLSLSLYLSISPSLSIYRSISLFLAFPNNLSVVLPVLIFLSTNKFLSLFLRNYHILNSRLKTPLEGSGALRGHSKGYSGRAK